MKKETVRRAWNVNTLRTSAGRTRLGSGRTAVGRRSARAAPCRVQRLGRGALRKLRRAFARQRARYGPHAQPVRGAGGDCERGARAPPPKPCSRETRSTQAKGLPCSRRAMPYRRSSLAVGWAFESAWQRARAKVGRQAGRQAGEARLRCGRWWACGRALPLRSARCPNPRPLEQLT